MVEILTPWFETSTGVARVRVVGPAAWSGRLRARENEEGRIELYIAATKTAAPRAQLIEFRVQHSRDGIDWVESVEPTSSGT
jgi:hypothetical protein